MQPHPENRGSFRQSWKPLVLVLVSLVSAGHSQTPDSFNPGASYAVYAMAAQADGSILAAGAFDYLPNVSQSRNGICRFNPDGTLDSTFNPGPLKSYQNPPHCLSIQADGKFLVGGAFTSLAGTARSHITRFNPDGSLDAAFNPGANTNVNVIVVQPDGKILVGGLFTNLAGAARAYIGRLNADGSLDASFDAVGDKPVHSMALQADGRIMVGGEFTTLGGVPRDRIARLNADGTPDMDFNPGADDNVYCLTLQPDGRILVGGRFSTLGSQTRQRLGRLNPDGSLDNDFNPGANGEIRSLVIQTDGKILAGGSFNVVDGQTRSNLVRLDIDGTVDGFDPSANGAVFCLGLQADGKVLAGGNFTTLGGLSRARVGRLNNDSPATQSLTFDGSTITWLRGGSSPEVNRATFEYSTNRLNWADLPVPDRVSGGWQLIFAAVPSNATIRARGFLAGGDNNGSGWFVESGIGPAATSSQPTDQISNVGGTVRFSVTAAGTGPVSYQWFRNGAAIGGATRSWLTRQAGTQDAGSSYDVAVSNALGTVRSREATLWVPGADSFDGGLVNSVYALAVQPDGTVVVGGAITAIGRFNPDGVLDSTFLPSVNGLVYCLNYQSDGKILAGGAFTTVAGQVRNRIVRLNADGKVDTAFNPGASGTVNAIAAQSDGKILVSGAFTNLVGALHARIGRLNADGSPDDNFNPAANNVVHSLAVQADGKIIVGGEFTTMNGTSRIRIARLHADGTLDTDFNPGATGIAVYCLALQSDGRILVGGNFTGLGGQSRQRIGRLNSDGSLDSAFNPGANGDIRSLIVQSDGKILVGGLFSTFGGQSRPNLARLNPDGALDTVFNPNSTGAIFCLALQADGKILAGGSFTTLWGTSRSRLGRLNNTSAPVQSLTSDGSTITWLRGGSTPEVNRVTFEYCTNGVDWFNLPAPERIPGGWQLTGIGISPSATIRARGHLASGYNDGSGWFVETGIGPPAISSQPVGKPLTIGESFRLSVTAVGTGSFSYQWFRDGVAVAGATNSWLNVSALPATTTYDVAVISPLGSIRSAPATIWLYGIDLTFNPGADSTVYVLAIQADGKILVGGAFTNSPGSHIARLNPNGTRDANFISNAISGSVYALAVQPDGKIVVGGSFTNLAGQARNAIGRLNSDGSLDTTFNAGVSGFYGPVVQCLAVQPDGKILVGGWFQFLAGQSRYCIGRLNSDGSLDAGFIPPSGGSPGFEAGVTSLVIESDGNILACGELTEANPNWRTFVERLNPDGSLNARLFSIYTMNPAIQYVICSAVQADGGVVLGGWFDGPNRHLARLNADGSWDTNFTAWADAPVFSLAMQADGKILVGGAFSNLAGQPSNRLGRLNPDGSLDSSFDLEVIGTNSSVHSLAIQTDGKILVGGSFTNLAGRSRKNIGRLNRTDAAIQELTWNGSDVVWLRGGVGPEVEPATLEATTNGTDWTYLGAGTRLTGTWQWSGVSVPADALIRARGFVVGKGSFWFVESLLATAPRTQPIILLSDGNFGFNSNRFGFSLSASFGHVVVVEGSTNLVNWIPLQTNLLYNEPILFSDSNSTNLLRRFYRGRLQ